MLFSTLLVHDLVFLFVVARCRETEFQCLDGKRCISFSSLCNGIVDCDDYSDEANCGLYSQQIGSHDHLVFLSHDHYLVLDL